MTLTEMWNRKTRIVTKKAANGHTHDDDFEDEENENISKLEAKVKELISELSVQEALLKEKDLEIIRLRAQLEKNMGFVQDIVIKLIDVKAQETRKPTAMETYAASKYSSSSSLAGPAKKLP